jgi:hypothetical protein
LSIRVVTDLKELPVRQGLLVLATVAAVLTLASAAAANPPNRDVGSQQDVTIVGQCVFPVLGHIEGSEIITTFSDNAGNYPSPVTGEPGIWYSSGRLALTFDTEGNITSVTSTGKLVNLCDQLGS